MGFAAEQLGRTRSEWQQMVDHPFLLHTRHGTIPFETFATWMRQDYLFADGTVPFIAILLAKAPEKHRAFLSGVLSMLQKELELFRERAAAVGVDLRGVAPFLVNHAYVQFLHATAFRETYACGFTVLFVAEKAYHDSWREVLTGIDRTSPWFPFVENWGGDAFARYVTQLEEKLDDLAADAGATERARMAELFEITVRYEIAFWEMAWTGTTSPEPRAG